jgi:hypothetical protein
LTYRAPVIELLLTTKTMGGPRNGFQALFWYFFVAAQTYAKISGCDAGESFLNTLQEF